MKVFAFSFMLFLLISLRPRDTIIVCPVILTLIPNTPGQSSDLAGSGQVTWSPGVSTTIPQEEIQYIVEVSETINFTNIVHTSNTITGGTSYVIPTLKINKLYFVRIKASDNNFLSNCQSITSFFRTAAPYNLHYITTPPRKIDWEGIASASSYCVRVSKHPSYSNLIVDECDITDTEFAVDFPAGIYFMKINATNSAGTGDFIGSVEIIVP